MINERQRYTRHGFEMEFPFSSLQRITKSRVEESQMVVVLQLLKCTLCMHACAYTSMPCRK